MCRFQQDTLSHCRCTLLGRQLRTCAIERRRRKTAIIQKAHPIPSSICKLHYHRFEQATECFFCSLHGIHRDKVLDEKKEFDWSSEQWSKVSDEDVARYEEWKRMDDYREQLRIRIHGYVEKGQHDSPRRSNRRRLHLKRLCHMGIDLVNLRKRVKEELDGWRDDVDGVEVNRVDGEASQTFSLAGDSVETGQEREEQNVGKQAAESSKETSSEETRTSMLLGNLEVTSRNRDSVEVLENGM